MCLFYGNLFINVLTITSLINAINADRRRITDAKSLRLDIL